MRCGGGSWNVPVRRAASMNRGDGVNRGDWATATEDGGGEEWISARLGGVGTHPIATPRKESSLSGTAFS